MICKHFASSALRGSLRNNITRAARKQLIIDTVRLDEHGAAVLSYVMEVKDAATSVRASQHSGRNSVAKLSEERSKDAQRKRCQREQEQPNARDIRIEAVRDARRRKFQRE